MLVYCAACINFSASALFIDWAQTQCVPFLVPTQTDCVPFPTMKPRRHGKPNPARARKSQKMRWYIYVLRGMRPPVRKRLWRSTKAAKSRIKQRQGYVLSFDSRFRFCIPFSFGGFTLSTSAITSLTQAGGWPTRALPTANLLLAR
jgi:hypothetical protein